MEERKAPSEETRRQLKRMQQKVSELEHQLQSKSQENEEMVGTM